RVPAGRAHGRPVCDARRHLVQKRLRRRAGLAVHRGQGGGSRRREGLLRYALLRDPLLIDAAGLTPSTARGFMVSVTQGPDFADAVTNRARTRVGAILRGKWRLDALLGVGGMAAVYAATHRNGKRGAVKMLHLELSTDEDARRRFLREGYAANAV